MARLTGNTTVRHPETGAVVALSAGDELPEFAAGLVGDHLLSEVDPDAESDDSDEGPPQPGGNASLDDWQTFARFQGATDDDLDGKSRNDLRDEFGK